VPPPDVITGMGGSDVSPAGQPFDGLTGQESNPDSSRTAVPVSPITAACFMPGADPGEGYLVTNQQLYGTDAGPAAAGDAARVAVRPGGQRLHRALTS
jgi:hypothetical protein